MRQEYAHVMRGLLAAVVLSALFSSAAIAGTEDFVEGAAAYRRGDYADAMRLLTPLAEQGNAVAQFDIGTMY